MTDKQNLRDKARDAVAEALGDAYDCLRVWSAWGIGTMSQDDFSLVTDDADRIAEIADAALDALGLPTLLDEIDRLREALSSIHRYGADTLSGRADGGVDDRLWQRAAVLEMTNRAYAALQGDGNA